LLFSLFYAKIPSSHDKTRNLMKGDILMSVKTQTITSLAPESAPREEVLSLVLALSPADQEWLTQQLARIDPWEEEDDDDELPESATLEEAIELYLADKCSLGRAAELAGVTRWDIMDVLKERNIPIIVDSHLSADEIDELAEELESEGVLYPEGLLYPEGI
jgi:predicted HTH domain antitoxin